MALRNEGPQYVLYDIDTGNLISLAVFDRRAEAVEAARELNDVIVVQLQLPRMVVAPQQHTYQLSLDGPLFRTQRELLWSMEQQFPERSAIRQLLSGLIELTDAIADQAHDNYGIDCLLLDPEDED